MAISSSPIFFSVIIPVHNKEPHLERSINSVLKQSYPNFELIIVDDASTDNSEQKLNDFTDKRIKRIKRNTPGPGGYAARNIGIDNAQFNWICFLDADDEWNTELLSTLNAIIAEKPKVNILSWGWSRIEGDKVTPNEYYAKYKKVAKPYFNYRLIDFLRGPARVIWTGAVAMHKKIFAEAGNFPEHRCIRGGDVDLWIRCLNVSDNNIFINKNLSYYYIDSVNMVTKNAKPACPCSYITLLDILKKTNDKDLIKVIHDFQNENIYAVAQRNVLSGGKIDYKLLAKMTFTKYTIISIVKVHGKRLIWLINKNK